MNKFLDFFRGCYRKLTVAALTTGCSVLAFAEGESAGGSGVSVDDINLTEATNAFKGMSSKVVNWVGDIAPYLAGFLGGMLVIVLIWVAVKWIMRGTKRA